MPRKKDLPQSNEPQPDRLPTSLGEVDNPYDGVKRSLVRLRGTPHDMAALPGQTPLSELSRIVLAHFVTSSPEAGIEQQRFFIQAMKEEDALPNRTILLKPEGETIDTFHLTLYIHKDRMLDFGPEQIDATLIPSLAIAARFIKAATAETMDESDITFADRLRTVYFEAYELQRLYMKWVNGSRSAAKQRQLFKKIPSPEDVHKYVDQALFGPHYPKNVPKIDFGIQDYLMFFGGPTVEEVKRNPMVLRREVDFKHFAQDPVERQRFLAAFSRYTQEVLPPDSFDEAVLRRKILDEEALWTQSEEIRQQLMTLQSSPFPLLKFLFQRALIYTETVKMVRDMYIEGTHDHGILRRRLNQANFTEHDTPYYGIISMAEFFLEGPAIEIQQEKKQGGQDTA